MGGEPTPLLTCPQAIPNINTVMNDSIVIYHTINNTKHYFNGGGWSSDRSEAICFSHSQYEHLLNDPIFTHHYNILWEVL